MNSLVTGGAGFIGRWVVKRLLEDYHNVWVLDNLSNGSERNLEEFKDDPNFRDLVIGDIKQDTETLSSLFKNHFDICYHLAAAINTQDSIDDPEPIFNNNVRGTFNVLEECRKNDIKMVFVSTCMVYEKTDGHKAISELHPTKPVSPYAASKISGENMVLAYYHSYGLPTVVIRAFNTYGPFQKSSGEGGVIAIFIKRNLEAKTLKIFGDGKQTRDFLYVDDCARGIVETGYSSKVDDGVINIGTGQDVAIINLAKIITNGKNQIRHVLHPHPQSEIQRLRCDYAKAKKNLDWKPRISLEEGIKLTEKWIKKQMEEEKKVERKVISVHEDSRPIQTKLLRYARQWIDEDDIQAVAEVLESDWLTTGPKIAEFEAQFAKYVGAKYAVAVSSGTAALHAACFAAGIDKGDEVITTPITFVASSNCILYMGGKPVFADIKENTYNIDPKEIDRKITDRTKAIIPVDFAGQPADLDAIHEIAQKHNLIVIEDAAHALGAECKGRRVGSISDLTTFSFHPVKHITTGEGGMVVTNDKECYEKLLIFRTHGVNKNRVKLRKNEGPWYYEMQGLGYNYRITDFQCALGISQLKKIDEFVKRRREIVKRYNDALKSIEEINTPYEKPEVKSTWHIYVIRLKLDRLKVSRKEIFEALRRENIGVQVHYIPIYYQPYYQKLGYKKSLCPAAERYYEGAITLPLFPGMDNKDALRVINTVKKIIIRCRK